MIAKLLGILRFALDAVLSIVIVLDELARPVYRPLLRWVAEWSLMTRFQSWVASQQRLVILVLLVIPFAIVEPLKIMALFWIASGRAVPGGITLALAYLAGFVLIERIYSAGHAKLMTIGWFAYLMDQVAAVRDAIKRRVMASAVWRRITRLRDRLQARLRRR